MTVFMAPGSSACDHRDDLSDATWSRAVFWRRWRPNLCPELRDGARPGPDVRQLGEALRPHWLLFGCQRSKKPLNVTSVRRARPAPQVLSDRSSQCAQADSRFRG
jgi:hypothetical protein